MAKIELVKLVKHGSTVWNIWRKHNSDLTVDLSNANLNGTDLSEAVLRSANLRGTDLTAANLGSADLREADLRDANLHAAYLVGANLSAANLRRVTLTWASLRTARLGRSDLRKANLSRADLREAILGGADLSGADLSDADLRGANLQGAELTDVDLRGADLRETNLVGARLVNANLAGTNLEEAIIGWTTFANNDLSAVKGLETATHSGPSTIGVDTLYKSEGRIPDIFLRGVGLPEVFITYFPSLISRPIEFYSCFISYSHADKSFARRLHDSLQGRGIRCWLDEHQLLPGDKIYNEVDRGIRFWDKVLLCCSKDALSSWWVDNEIKIAFQKEQQLWRERNEEVLKLIPLNLDDCLFSGQWESGLATEVKARMAANFGGWEQDNKRFEEQFERLVKALRTGGRGKEPAPPTLL